MSLLTQERFGSNRLTALHLASDCGKKEAIALLLGNGADPTIKDKLKKVLFSTTCLGVSSSCIDYNFRAKSYFSFLSGSILVLSDDRGQECVQAVLWFESGTVGLQISGNPRTAD